MVGEYRLPWTEAYADRAQLQPSARYNDGSILDHESICAVHQQSVSTCGGREVGGQQRGCGGGGGCGSLGKCDGGGRACSSHAQATSAPHEHRPVDEAVEDEHGEQTERVDERVDDQVAAQEPSTPCRTQHSAAGRCGHTDPC